MTEEQYKTYLQSDKWKWIAHKRLEIDNYTCTMCGSRGTQFNPLEIHHLSYRYLGQEQDRIFEDLTTLCHTCHAGIHTMMNRITSPSGRRGWKNNATVPDVNVFTLTGETLESRRVKNG